MVEYWSYWFQLLYRLNQTHIAHDLFLVLPEQVTYATYNMCDTCKLQWKPGMFNYLLINWTPYFRIVTPNFIAEVEHATIHSHALLPCKVVVIQEISYKGVCLLNSRAYFSIVTHNFTETMPLPPTDNEVTWPCCNLLKSIFLIFQELSMVQV